MIKLSWWRAGVARQLSWGAFPQNNYGRKFRRYQYFNGTNDHS